MVIYSVFIVLVILFLFGYMMQKNFIAPFSLFLSSFLLASALICLNVDNWDVVIDDTFLIYLFTGILAFGTGCFLAEFLFGGEEKSTVNSIELQAKVKSFVTVYPAKILAIVSLLCTAGFVIFMINSVEFTTNLSVLLRRIYDSFAHGGSTSIFSTQLKEIALATGKISVFEILLEHYFSENKKVRISLLFPVIGYLVCALVSTDRNIFLRFVLYSMCLWILFYLNVAIEKISAVNWKIFKRVCLCVLLTGVMFFGLGKAKNATSDIESMLSIYGGSGLYNFNMYVASFSEKELQYGADTFSETLKTINALIKGRNDRVMPFDEFISYTSSNNTWYSSNIYTAFRPYINDFGYAGVIIYPLILGIFFEFLFIQTKKYKFGLWWILYSMLMYALVYTAILEQFFRRWHLGMVYEIGWMVTLYYVIYILKMKDLIRVKNTITQKSISC